MKRLLIMLSIYTICFINNMENSVTEIKTLDVESVESVVSSSSVNKCIEISNIKSFNVLNGVILNNIINKIEETKEKEEERRERESYNIEFELTYYSRHPSENGGYNCTSTGKPLREGIVASNYYPIGTKIKLQDGRVFVVEDRGGSNFNNEYRLDVFVDTYDRKYVNSLGRTKIKGKIIK